MTTFADYQRSMILKKAFREGVLPEDIAQQMFNQFNKHNIQLLASLQNNQFDVKKHMDLIVDELNKLPPLDGAKRSIAILKEVSKQVETSINQLGEETHQATHHLIHQQKLKEASLKVLNTTNATLENLSPTSEAGSIVQTIGPLAEIAIF